MAEEKGKAIEKDLETVKPAGSQDNQLSDKDLAKVTGGTPGESVSINYGHVEW